MKVPCQLEDTVVYDWTILLEPVGTFSPDKNEIQKSMLVGLF